MTRANAEVLDFYVDHLAGQVSLNVSVLSHTGPERHTHTFITHTTVHDRTDVCAAGYTMPSFPLPMSQLTVTIRTCAAPHRSIHTSHTAQTHSIRTLAHALCAPHCGSIRNAIPPERKTNSQPERTRAERAADRAEPRRVFGFPFSVSL